MSCLHVGVQQALSYIPASARPDVHKGCARLADASHDFEHVQLADGLWCPGLQFKSALCSLYPYLCSHTDSK